MAQEKGSRKKVWRELGVNENIIAEIHDFDRIAYNSDDRFYKRLYNVGDFYEEIIADETPRKTTTVEQLLDEVENPAMYKILKKTSKRTLQILLMRVRGYSVKDISEILHISKTSVYERIKNVREKLNKCTSPVKTDNRKKALLWYNKNTKGGRCYAKRI